jgi:predicted ATPase
MEFVKNRFVSEVTFCREPMRDLYLNELPIVRYFKNNRRLAFDSPVTIFVGENGTGKGDLRAAESLRCDSY